MPDETTLSSLVHWYHALMALGGILGVFGLYHRCG